MIRKWCLSDILYALVNAIVYRVRAVKSRGTYINGAKILDNILGKGYALLRVK